MRGLHLEAGTVRFRDDLPEPRVRSGDVRVRVRLAGVCATDLALARGYMGFQGVPGHEFVGEALDGPLAGRRVVGEINAGCGACARCQSGDPRHCATRDVLGILTRPGAFAEELTLPGVNLLPVPDEVPDEAAVFAEPLAAAFEILEQVDLAHIGRALVVGDGRLGLLCAQVLARAGPSVVLAGRHPERGTWLPAGIEHVGALPSVGEERFALVVEATGQPGILAEALRRVAPRGTLVLKTTAEGLVPVDLAQLVIDEITLLGSRCGRFESALAALADGSIVTEPMIHARLPLEAGAEAFERAAARGTLKVLLDPTLRPTDV